MIGLRWRTTTAESVSKCNNRKFDNLTSFTSLKPFPVTLGSRRLRKYNLGGAARITRTQGAMMKKYCSKVSVKSKPSRQGASTVGPNTLSAVGRHATDAFLETAMRLNAQSLSDLQRASRERDEKISRSVRKRGCTTRYGFVWSELLTFCAYRLPFTAASTNQAGEGTKPVSDTSQQGS
jgi:hypothetical protein